jgi:hypothetical protein
MPRSWPRCLRQSIRRSCRKGSTRPVARVDPPLLGKPYARRLDWSRRGLSGILPRTLERLPSNARPLRLFPVRPCVRWRRSVFGVRCRTFRSSAPRAPAARMPDPAAQMPDPAAQMPDPAARSLQWSALHLRHPTSTPWAGTPASERPVKPHWDRFKKPGLARADPSIGPPLALK